ncbi:TPR-like protein [Athelia psychrophila]|uniref:TPR-like protein n=1 Tax=Athelia psychrophila TaxID=1759441 RepID=A0A166PVW6_9AGAM|nr:TPR-like protein [Fibularhizoctonia sp. CBS 109695]
MLSLAQVYASLGRYQEAEPQFLKVLAAAEKQLGPYHLNTLATVNHLALLHDTQGRFDEAESLYARALEGQEKQLGTRHPVTLQGKFGKAESFYMRALAGKEKQLGADHSETLATVNNLGLLYTGQGNYSGAEQFCARALAGYEKQLGNDHPKTLATVNNLGLLYTSLGKYEKAECFYVRALAGKEKQLGADHPSTLMTVHKLAYLRHQQGKHQEAKTLYRRALEESLAHSCLAPNSNSTSFACLVALDANALGAANYLTITRVFYGTTAFAPVIDGRFIVERPTVTLGRGRINGDVAGSDKHIRASKPHHEHCLYLCVHASLPAAEDQAVAIIGECIHGEDVYYYFSSAGQPFNNTAFITAFAQSFLDVVRFLDPNAKFESHAALEDVGCCRLAHGDAVQQDGRGESCDQADFD